MAKTKPAWTNDPYQVPWRKALFKGTPRQPRSTWDRFNSRLVPGSGDCWGWSGAYFKQTGYTLLVMRSQDGKWRPTVAHRIAYELYIAEIPPGLVIDHLCRNRGCVNPWHMEPVTRGENVRRGEAPSAVTVRENRCNRGHELTAENSIIRLNGKRECRECVRARDRLRNKTEERRAHYRAAYRRRKGIASA